MKQISPFIYALITPFNPKWSFNKIEPIENKKRIGVSSFILSCILIIAAHTIGQSKNSTNVGLELFFYILGFSFGLILKQLFTVYILIVLLKRFQKTKIKWQETLCIVSFSLIPLLLNNILYIIQPKAHQIGQIFFSLWNIALIIAGIYLLKKIPLWKSIITVTTIIILFGLIKLTFIGIEI
ncbi:MAG: YIP1 family protein [Flavobacteriales bacterium]